MPKIDLLGPAADGAELVEDPVPAAFGRVEPDGHGRAGRRGGAPRRAQGRVLRGGHGRTRPDETEQPGAEPRAGDGVVERGAQQLGEPLLPQPADLRRVRAVEVDAAPGDDVHAGRARDLRQARGLRPEPPSGEVDDGPLALGGREPELTDGERRVVEDEVVLEREEVPAHEPEVLDRDARIVRRRLARGRVEDPGVEQQVLVHRRHAELGGGDRPEDRLRPSS